jgi:hypothetical protein
VPKIFHPSSTRSWSRRVHRQHRNACGRAAAVLPFNSDRRRSAPSALVVRTPTTERCRCRRRMTRSLVRCSSTDSMPRRYHRAPVRRRRRVTYDGSRSCRRAMRFCSGRPRFVRRRSPTPARRGRPLAFMLEFRRDYPVEHMDSPRRSRSRAMPAWSRGEHARRTGGAPSTRRLKLHYTASRRGVGRLHDQRGQRARQCRSGIRAMTAVATP